MRRILLAVMVAATFTPGTASAACLSTTPGDWTVPDPAGDQTTAGDTDIAALHVLLDASCRLTMSLDVNGAVDENANDVLYDLDTDAGPGFDRGAAVVLERPGRPGSVGRGIGGPGGMSYFYDGVLQPSGPLGWTGTLDGLEIAKPGTTVVRAYVSEDPPRGGDDAVGPFTLPIQAVTTDDVPDNAAAPTIAGPAEAGGTLNCAPGNWHGLRPITFAYQWLRDGAPIEAATTPLYATGADDVRHLVACSVTAGNAAGTSTAPSAGILVAPARAPVVRFVVVRTGARTTVRYRASETARVVFTVKRERTTVGAFARRAHRGFNRVRLAHTGRSGDYQLLARPRDRAGHVGRLARVRFRVS